MQRTLFTSICFIVAVMLVSPQVWATGNVLLPTNTNNYGDIPQPNLGITAPFPPTSNASVPSLMTPAPPSPSSPAQNPFTLPPQQSIQTTPPVPPAPMPPASVITKLDPALAAKLPRGTIPTTIIHQADIFAQLSQMGQNLPYGLTIAIGRNSIFSAKDVQNISTKLGLGSNQITSSCILSMRGFMQTDKGNYLLAAQASPQMSVRYDGTIKSYMMTAIALCVASHLPPDEGFIVEMGGRYIISLQQIKCDPPNRKVSTLTITYDGSAKSTCSYE